MRRREFVGLLGGVAVAWPIGAHAQQATLIGFLSARSPDESTELVAAFREGLREAGFVEGQNLLIEYRWAEGRYDRLRALAAELVGLRVALLFTAGGPVSVLAAKAATSTIPIVFSGAADPVRLGLVSDLNRPGGNVTGMSLFTLTLVPKSVEMLHELLPTATVAAYLANPSSPSTKVETQEAQATASTLGIQLHVLNARTEGELDKAFASLGNLGARGLVVPADAFFDSHRDRLVALSARYAVPAIYPWRDCVVAGGLMSYGTSLTDSYRRAGIYAGRILKGERPADLPVQQPTKFELAINLKTAKSLGLTVPPSILLRVDEAVQ
ncbi:MAG TPA: ABC transporter substrate-binding protein [Casimicrobiaceae bacterium]|nr:ABC transporter substrate-binding protein [Casimicrobiaceae bacterium]